MKASLIGIVCIHFILLQSCLDARTEDEPNAYLMKTERPTVAAIGNAPYSEGAERESLRNAMIMATDHLEKEIIAGAELGCLAYLKQHEPGQEDVDLSHQSFLISAKAMFDKIEGRTGQGSLSHRIPGLERRRVWASKEKLHLFVQVELNSEAVDSMVSMIADVAFQTLKNANVPIDLETMTEWMRSYIIDDMHLKIDH